MKKIKIKRTEGQINKERKSKMRAIISAYIDELKENGSVASDSLKKYGFTYDQIRYYFKNMEGLLNAAKKARPKDFYRMEKKRLEEEEKEKEQLEKQEDREEKIHHIMETYANIIENKGYVSMNDMIDEGYTKDTITYYFGSLTRLESSAREHFPESFFDIDVSEVIGSYENLNKFNDFIHNKKRFILTTGVTGCKADYAGVESIKNYCKRKDAASLILVASDPAHNMFAPDAEYGTIDEALCDDDNFAIVPCNTDLNSNLSISTIKLSAKHIDPATSMKRIASKNGTFIFASPKQRLAPVAVSNTKMPHFVMTTGAITRPDYTSSNYMSDRTAFIAKHDHVMGGLIIEIVDDTFYHFRQFQLSEDGSFVDLGIRYHPDGSIEEERPEAFILGDWHCGVTDPNAKAAWEEVITSLKVKRVITHDIFDGMSINHHERNNTAQRAKIAIAGQHNLNSEINMLVRDIDYLSSICDELVIVKSNHDEFLDRYLASGYYVKDPENHRYALELAIALIDGHDPLAYAVDEIGLSEPNKVRWLDRDEDFKIAGVQLGAHGDLGANGARGSLKNIEAAYSNSITGHSHSPEILRNSWQVGTSSYLKLNYNRGPSSWLHTSCLLYKDGTRQLINSLNGKWRM